MFIVYYKTVKWKLFSWVFFSVGSKTALHFFGFLVIKIALSSFFFPVLRALFQTALFLWQHLQIGSYWALRPNPVQSIVFCPTNLFRFQTKQNKEEKLSFSLFWQYGSVFARYFLFLDLVYLLTNGTGNESGYGITAGISDI